MQRETCRLQPETPRRTVPRLRATLLSLFPAWSPAAPPASGRCSGRHHAELQGSDQAIPPGSAACPNRVPQRRVRARYTPLVHPTPTPRSHPYPYQHPDRGHFAAGRRILSPPSPRFLQSSITTPPHREHPKGQSFLGSLSSHHRLFSFPFLVQRALIRQKKGSGHPGFLNCGLVGVAQPSPLWADATPLSELGRAEQGL